MGKPTYMAYFGGKAKFEDFVVPIIPKNIKRYIEPFAGSFAIYFLTDFNDDVEIIFNDLNKDQANVFECSKNYNKYLQTIKFHLEDPKGSLYCKETDIELRKIFYKELYYKYKRSNFANENFNIPDFNRASVYAYLSTAAFNSCHFTAAGYSGFSKDRMKFLSFIKKLENKDLQKKFSKISKVEYLNFEESILKYDSPDTFIYIDAPYFSLNSDGNDTAKRASWYGTKDEFGQEQHMRLLRLLPTLKSRWAMSYYYFPALEHHLPKDKYIWLEKEFFRSSASFSENKKIKGNELLILNYTPNSLVNILTDEIEEANGGAFIRSDISDTEKVEIIKTFATKLISEQKDIDPDIAEIVNENYKELLYTEEEEITAEDFDKKFDENKEDVIKHLDLEQISRVNKEEDIDDFWLS